MLEQELRELEDWEVHGPDATVLFDKLEDPKDAEEYNYEHFRSEHFGYDAKATLKKIGIQPGDLAPDFVLPLATGGEIRLSELRGRPVLLHFGSPT